MIAQSEVDLALVTSHPSVAIDDRFTVFQPVHIATDRLVVVRSYRVGDTDGPLHVSHELTYIGQVWRANRNPRLAPNEVQHGMAADIRAYCLADQGRGVLPASLVEADIQSGQLVLCPMETEITYRISLYCSARAHRRAKRVHALCAIDLAKVSDVAMKRLPLEGG